MAYAALPTVVDGTVIQSSWGNQVKANFDAGPNALATAAGQIFYATATGVLLALPVGATSSFLQVVGGAPAWSPSPTIAAGAVLAFAPDANLYRVGADQLRTDDAFSVMGATLIANQDAYVDYGSAGKRLYFGAAADTSLYRSGAGALKTDGTLAAAFFFGNASSATALSSPLPTVASALGAATALANATYTDLCSVALTAGTWLVLGTLLADATATTGGPHVTGARLRDATAGTVLREATGTTGGAVNWYATITVVALCVLGAAATIWLSGASTSTLMRAAAQAPNVGPGPTGVAGTTLVAVKLGG